MKVNERSAGSLFWAPEAVASDGFWRPERGSAASGVLEPPGEADAQRRTEELLDVRVGRADDAIEVRLVEHAERQLADEEHRVLVADAEPEPVRRPVAAE